MSYEHEREHEEDLFGGRKSTESRFPVHPYSG